MRLAGIVCGAELRLKPREKDPSALGEHSYMPGRSLQRRSGAQDSNSNRKRNGPNESSSRSTTSNPGRPRRGTGRGRS